MGAYYERRRVRAAGWSRAVATFAALLLLVSVLGHRFGFLETSGFLAVLVLVAALGCAGLLLAALSFRRIWIRGDRGGRDMTIGTVVSLAVLTPFLIAAVLFARTPPLSDISTDIADPPKLSALRRNAAPVPDAAALQAKYYPEITGRRYVLEPELVVASVVGLMSELGWQAEEPVATTGVETLIRAVARTPLLAFPSDVAVRVTDEGGSTYVDVRSASRLGSYDLGCNARRVSNFLKELDDRIAAQALAAPSQ